MKLTRRMVAAITGAGSGIGRALALNLAGRGCALAIADIRSETLKDTAELARTAGAYAVTAHVCDVSDLAAVEGFAAEAHAAHGGVQLLVNNAGVALGGTFQDISRGRRPPPASGTSLSLLASLRKAAGHTGGAGGSRRL